MKTFYRSNRETWSSSTFITFKRPQLFKANFPTKPTASRRRPASRQSSVTRCQSYFLKNWPFRYNNENVHNNITFWSKYLGFKILPQVYKINNQNIAQDFLVLFCILYTAAEPFCLFQLSFFHYVPRSRYLCVYFSYLSISKSFLTSLARTNYCAKLLTS